MRAVEPGDITNAVESFLRSRNGQVPGDHRRERSWDFCFNYFQSNPEPTRDIELSCLQLGYYLASWGMLRGSSYLFRETNARHYRGAIEVIERYNPMIVGFDAHRFIEPGAQEMILSAYVDLRQVLLPRGGSSRTLVSKVMMGTWGVLPSFDTYFVAAFRSLAETNRERAAFNTVGSRSLTLLGEFYGQNKAEIDRLAQHYTTLEFTTGQVTDRPLSRAKIIDMYGFHKGFSG